MESMAFRPVWSGSFTGCRWTTLGVKRLTQRVDHAADQGVANRDRGHATGASHLVTLVDFRVLAENRRADIVLLQIKHQAHNVTGKQNQLRHLDVLQTPDAGDAIADLQDGADGLHRELGVIFLKLFLDY
jgi:hypothetical protein